VQYRGSSVCEPGPISKIVAEERSDPESLEAAVAAAVQFLSGKRKSVLLVASELRAPAAEKQAIELAETLGPAITVMVAAKSFFPEDHPQFAGIYWGEVSTDQARDRRLV
jgi:pyruvate decarboxylase